VRERIIERFNRIVTGIAQAMECEAAINYQSGTLAVSNDAPMAANVRALAGALPGITTVADDERAMGSEDMAFMMDTIPGCYFFIGSGNSEKGLDFPHHHPRFDFDERALTLGAALMAQAAAQYVLK
jgi:amidohydrolase